MAFYHMIANNLAVVPRVLISMEERKVSYFLQQKGQKVSNSSIPIKEFRLELSDLKYTGHDLVRPESVLAQPNGTLWTSNGRGGVTRIDPDGTQQFIGGLGGEPNGLALADDGSILVANIAIGGVQKLHATGRVETLVGEIDGVKTTCANFVFIDSKQRIWMAFSTREAHWWPAAAQPRPDGYIALLDEKGVRIVGDGIYFTNEIRLDAREEHLYVAETMMNRIIRFRVGPDGTLSEKEVVGPENLGLGGATDGFAFDSEGNIWVTTVIRNGLGIITADGDYHVVFEDPNEAVLATFEEKIANGTAEPADMAAAAGSTLQFLTSVTFAGPDLQTIYVGSLAMNRLPTFRSPVAGLPMRHWR
jgi:gluconolactonase